MKLISSAVHAGAVVVRRSLLCQTTAVGMGQGAPSLSPGLIIKQPSPSWATCLQNPLFASVTSRKAQSHNLITHCHTSAPCTFMTYAWTAADLNLASGCMSCPALYQKLCSLLLGTAAYMMCKHTVFLSVQTTEVLNEAFCMYRQRLGNGRQIKWNPKAAMVPKGKVGMAGALNTAVINIQYIRWFV